MRKIDKILFHIYSLGHGGAERVVCTLAEELERQGKEVLIATLAEEKSEYPLPAGVRRINVGLSEAEEKKGKLGRMNCRVRHLRDCLKKERPDVVFAFMQTANYRAIAAARPLHIPVIISVRSDPRVDYASKKQKLLSGWLYKKAAGAVFQTAQARDFFPPAVAQRATVILNPINEKYRKSEKALSRRKAMVSVGRFHEAKDYMTLVKAFELFLEEHGDYVLEIYGGDSGDNTIHQVKEFVHAHGLDEKILLMGNRDDVESCIHDAAAYILSSKYEGMPNALMEAMAMGLPVIATDCPCGGPAALIEDGANGLLCEVGNPKEMAAAMGKMAEYPEEAERVATEAMKIRELASTERIAGEWLAYAERI
ncbi:MAG: glycosyltransferase [Lachnospiraceae bacterium]|nr:glycosyltransferase [Lachnospiraceae bacterium]